MTKKNKSVPHHVAIVMDGNGRWAKKRFLPRLAGHRQGVQTLKRCVRTCAFKGVRVLTVFAFSSENWARPPDEVSGLMKLFCKVVANELAEMGENGVRLCFIGERSTLPSYIVEVMEHAENNTKDNTAFVLNICFNYGGRWDVAQAAAKLMDNRQAITERSLQEAMAMNHVPDPDLLIRTGGEQRISNFLLWQCAYSELYFADVLWPDFNDDALEAALQEYAKRERRFGKTSEQIANKDAGTC